mmetsp:Transcript_760/g.2136  ORF Transcript_760/g.2136 Transcript_760/m.2136 type:complete len:204 (-) Transcript_760:1230-1841(-)
MSTSFLLLAVLAVLSSTCVSAFVPTGLRQTNTQKLLRCEIIASQKACRVDLEAVVEKNPAIGRGRALWKRLDTLEAAGLAQDAGTKNSNEMTRSDTKRTGRPFLFTAAAHGAVGHAGLLIVSTLIVNIVKAIFFTKPPTEEEELLASTGDAQSKQGGMMDRCPWPFIFFHDPKQGMKDSPTWVVVCWYVLYRAWKYRSAVTVV